MAALDFIPSGSQYNNLRGMLNILQRDFPDLYASLGDARVQGWVTEINSGTGRDADQIRDDIAKFVIGADRIAEFYGITAGEAQRVILGGNEGGINFADLTPPPTPPGPAPAPPPPPEPPLPEPEPETPEPIDYHARARALYPWLPTQLLDQFANFWAESGDATLALAELRATPEYEQFFPGIKRDDGSLRMTEQEWFSTREAYSRLLQDFGLNAQLFEGKFTELMEGDVSPSELMGRLGGAFELMNNIPEVREAFEGFQGIEGGAAVFAWFINPDLGDAIINKQVSLAQVAGEGLARGFDVQEGFAERLVAGGVDQGVARNLFIQAEGQLQTLDDLVKRHRDPDDTFDLSEFADANVFGSAEQTRRIRRLLRAEASLFTPREVGMVQTEQDFALTGLSPR